MRRMRGPYVWHKAQPDRKWSNTRCELCCRPVAIHARWWQRYWRLLVSGGRVM